MNKTLDQLAEEFTLWSVPTFLEADAITSLTKCTYEIEEIANELDRNAGTEVLAEEYADAIMCLFDSAARAGLSVQKINEAFAHKLEKNKARKWKKNSDNTYSHVK